MLDILVTLEVSQLLRSSTDVREEQERNMLPISVTLEVSQLLRSPTDVREEQ